MKRNMLRPAYTLAFAATVALAIVTSDTRSAEPSSNSFSLAQLAKWRSQFSVANPVPHPPDNPPSSEKRALGERLFSDTKLSADGRIACATCHDPRLGFSDGEVRGAGITGTRLLRHTPTLWNTAWSPLLYWDGRAQGYENQARFPIEHPNEMGNPLEKVAERLSTDADYRRSFARAFPSRPAIDPVSIVQAIATYQRSLISPPTRFDTWLAGAKGALSIEEIAGFQLFVGKARCVACHSGYAFSDASFHDIGLATDDPGRGAIISVERVRHAFKTPTLRELAWTAPYMHDGSKATLEDVVDHYAGGIIRRPTLSQDINAGLALTADEKQALVAFLQTLSSATPPRPRVQLSTISSGRRTTIAASRANRVGQKDKAFSPNAVRVRVGGVLSIVNDDSRTHNVRVDDPLWTFNSGAQEPGEVVELRPAKRGTFTASCGIHPNMQLRIEVD